MEDGRITVLPNHGDSEDEDADAMVDEDEAEDDAVEMLQDGTGDMDLYE